MSSFAQVTENQAAIPMSPDELIEIYDFISSLFVFFGYTFSSPIISKCYLPIFLEK